MAKDKERQVARILYVDQNKTGKEIALLTGVSEKTISKWVLNSGWRTERDAKVTSHTERVANIKLIISTLAKQRLDLIKRVAEAKKMDDNETILTSSKEASSIDDAISKWNKTLANIDKENRIAFSEYLGVMTSIFKALQHFDPTLYIETIAFQEAHIYDMAKKLG